MRLDRRRGWKFAFALAIHLHVASLAAADPAADRKPFTPTGPYAAVAGIVMHDDFDESFSLARLPIAKTDPSFGVTAWLGHRFHPNFAVEGQFDWIDGFDVRIDNGHKGRPHTDLDGWALSLNGKAYLPLGRFQPFVKLGVGALRAEIDTAEREHLASDRKKEDFVLRFGGGIDLYATRNVALVVSGEYVRPVDALKDIPYSSVTLGLQYSF